MGWRDLDAESRYRRERGENTKHTSDRSIRTSERSVSCQEGMPRRTTSGLGGEYDRASDRSPASVNATPSEPGASAGMGPLRDRSRQRRDPLSQLISPQIDCSIQASDRLNPSFGTRPGSQRLLPPRLQARLPGSGPAGRRNFLRDFVTVQWGHSFHSTLPRSSPRRLPGSRHALSEEFHLR